MSTLLGKSWLMFGVMWVIEVSGPLVEWLTAVQLNTVGVGLLAVTDAAIELTRFCFRCSCGVDNKTFDCRTGPSAGRHATSLAPTEAAAAAAALLELAANNACCSIWKIKDKKLIETFASIKEI